MEAIWALVALSALGGVARAAVWGAEQPMDGAARNAAPGQFVGLSEGVTHYQLEGPEDGPVILCIHGLTTPSFVFDAMVPGLVAGGYRVLRYDLYGRGFSDRPKGAYDVRRFTGQAIELLDALQIDAPVTVLGYSMGGAVATALTQAHGARVERLVLLAPGGLGHDLGRFSEWCAAVPVLGDWAFATLGGWVLRQDARNAPDTAGAVRDLTARIQAETRGRGYMRGVLSSLRHMLSVDQAGTHAALAQSGVPLTAIWGAADTVIPLQAMDRLARANPSARQEVIEGSGHDLPSGHSAEVLRLLFG